MPTVAFPPKARRIIYYSYTGVGLVLGCIQVGFAAAQAAQPAWLTVVLAVFAFLAGGLGLTAASNLAMPAKRTGNELDEPQ